MPESFEIETSVQASIHYTLLSPFDGVLDKLEPAGTICRTPPSDIPAGLFIPDVYSPEITEAGYRRTAERSFAHVSPVDQTLMRDAVAERTEAVLGQLRNYGLATYQPARAPWLDYQFTDPSGAMFQRFTSEYLVQNRPSAEYEVEDLIVALDQATPGVVPEPLRAMFDYVSKRMDEPLHLEAVRSALRDLLLWILKDQERLILRYGVSTDPYLPLLVEPNSLDLLRRGKIRVLLQRIQPANGSALRSAPVENVRSLIDYWKESRDKNRLSSKDYAFIDLMLFEKYQASGQTGLFDYSEAARRAQISQIVTEGEAAIAHFEAHIHLQVLIGKTALEADFSRNLEANKDQMAAAVGNAVMNDPAIAEFRDQVPRWMYAFATPDPPKTGPGSLMPKRTYQLRSKLRVLNEIRPSVAYDSSILSVRERPGYLFATNLDWIGGQTLPSFDCKFYLWHKSLPANFSDDDIPFAGTLRPVVAWSNAGLPEPISLVDIENEIAFGLAALAMDVAENRDVDQLAAFIRELELRKSRAGGTLVIEGSRMRETQRLLQEAYWREMSERRAGHFFPPEPARIVARLAEVGDFVHVGEPICTNTPIFQFAISGALGSAEWLSRPYVGERVILQTLSHHRLLLSSISDNIDLMPSSDEAKEALQTAFDAHLTGLQIKGFITAAAVTEDDPKIFDFSLIADVDKASRYLASDHFSPTLWGDLKAAGLLETDKYGVERFALPEGLFTEGETVKFRITKDRG